jgi:capsule polysaccharide export protein KpsE/RkpR
MRAFEGQHSDNVAIKRSREQKQRQLAQLKEQLATLKSHTAPTIREALVKRIADLEDELRQPAKPQGAGPRGGSGGGPAGESRFPPRRRS